MKLKKGIKSLLVMSLLAALLIPSAAFASDTDASAQIPVTVNVAEGTPAGTTFKVKLTANDESYPMPEKTGLQAQAKDSEDQDESFDGSFGPITYTKTGDYYYTVTQEKGSVNDVVYDETSYTVMVRVENQFDASGNYVGLKAAASAWKGAVTDIPDSGDKLSKLTFDNDFTEATTTEDNSETTTEGNSETTTEGKKTTKKTKSVKTGDNSNVVFWIALAVIAAAACIMLMLADQKRKKGKK